MNFDSIIPLPQQIEYSGKKYDVTDCLSAYYSGSDRRISLFLNSMNCEFTRVDSMTQADLVLLNDEIAELPADLKPTIVKQAYTLTITPEQLKIVAPDATGLFYGLQSLNQLLLADQLPCGRIIDWPDLEFRGQHLTLGSGYMPNYDEFVQLIIKMSSFKINSFTIEYDGSFPWECYPFITQPMAFTKDQYRNLIALANDHFIDVIPLIDSLGHQEHYLCHDQLKHLRELPDSVAELCASNPQSQAFIKSLWQEVLEVHKGATYVNITGDECFRLGDFCPRCKPFAESNSLAKLHSNYYRELAEWMLQQGVRPMMWDDMLIKHPENISNYPKEIIMLDWCYFGKDLPVWEFTYGLHGPIYKEDLASVPREFYDLYSPYWLHESTAPDFTPWPYVRFFIDQGFEVIGAGAGSVNKNGKAPQPDFQAGIANPKSFADTLVKCNATGLLNTFWSSFTSIFTAWSSVVAGADFSWHSRDEKQTDYLDRFDGIYLGTDGKFTEFATEFDKREFADNAGFGIADSLGSAKDDMAFMALYQETTDACRRHPDYLQMFKPALTYCQAKNNLRRHSVDAFKARIQQGADTVISLSDSVNASYKSIPGSVGGRRIMLPPGRQTALGVDVEILPSNNNLNNGIILGCKNNPDFPRRIEGIAVNDCYDMLMFTHTGFFVNADQQLAAYEVVYEDDSKELVPVVGNQHVGDWFGGVEVLSEAVEVFRCYGDGNEGKRLSAYMCCWQNPFPGKRIKQINMQSADQDGYLMLFALTGRTFITAGKAEPVIEEGKLQQYTFKKFKDDLACCFKDKCHPAHIERGLKMLNIDSLIELEDKSV